MESSLVEALLLDVNVPVQAKGAYGAFLDKE
jgi:hypothetical protein